MSDNIGMTELLKMLATGMGGRGGTTGGLPDLGTKRTALTLEELNKTDVSEDIATLTMDELVDTLSSADRYEFFARMAELFEFNGFNQEEIFNTLKKYAAIAGRTREQFIEDIAKMLTYYIKRGTTINKRGRASAKSEEAATEAEELMRIYHILDGVEGLGSKGSNVITLGRLMSTFPEVVGMLLVVLGITPIGEKGIVPICIMFPGAYGMIPRDPVFDPLYSLLLDWAVTFDKIINRLKRNARNEKFDPKKVREEQDNWGSIARNQSRLTDKTRFAWLSKWCYDYKLNVTMNDKGQFSLPTGMDLMAKRSETETAAAANKLKIKPPAEEKPGPKGGKIKNPDDYEFTKDNIGEWMDLNWYDRIDMSKPDQRALLKEFISVYPGDDDGKPLKKTDRVEDFSTKKILRLAEDLVNDKNLKLILAPVPMKEKINGAISIIVTAQEKMK